MRTISVALNKNDRDVLVKALLAYAKFGEVVPLMGLALEILASNIAISVEGGIEELSAPETEALTSAIVFCYPMLKGAYPEDAEHLAMLAERISDAITALLGDGGEQIPLPPMRPTRGALVS